MKSRVEAARAAWRERTVQAVLAVILWWAIYWRVTAGYGPGSAVIAATCTAWGYVIASSYAAYLINRRISSNDGPRGPRTPTGRWPGARP